MITTVNPGSRLELVANLRVDKVSPSTIYSGELVFDTQSGGVVSLATLLRSFHYDPAEVRGWVRITIEPCEPHSDHALHNVRVAS